LCLAGGTCGARRRKGLVPLRANRPAVNGDGNDTSLNGRGSKLNNTPLDGIWRLVEARSCDAQGRALPPPYGVMPLGMVQIQNGRMLAALCNADDLSGSDAAREYVSYGGPCQFDGERLITAVDLSARVDWLGGEQVREAELSGDRLVLRPPLREYGGVVQRRELIWERVWSPPPAAA